MTTRARRQYSYPTAQSSERSDYVPGRTRNLAREAMYEGHSGIVIPFQQKVGAVAMADTFEHIAANSYSADTEQLAGLFATVSFGSSFHSFAQRPQHSVHRRHGALPDMTDRETGVRLLQEGLITKAQAGLSAAAEVATTLEDMVWNDVDPRRIQNMNYTMGKITLSNALDLAAIRHRVGYETGNEVELQDAAWRAAEASSMDAIHVTATLGTRPTIAQLMDPSSPWMRHLYDNSDVISQLNHDELNDNIRARADEFTRAA